jgi:hypothetical protein
MSDFLGTISSSVRDPNRSLDLRVSFGAHGLSEDDLKRIQNVVGQFTGLTNPANVFLPQLDTGQRSAAVGSVSGVKPEGSTPASSAPAGETGKTNPAAWNQNSASWGDVRDGRNNAAAKFGDQGDSVSGMQQRLKALGYDLGQYGPNKDGVDGKWGVKTQAAYEQFKKDHGGGSSFALDMTKLDILSAGKIQPPQSGSPNGGQQGRGGDTSCPVPWISQADSRVPGHDNPSGGHWTACYRAVTTMADQAGVRLPGAVGGSMIGSNTAEGRGYLDTQLAQNRPVAARVDHNGKGHYVLINGSGTGPNGQRYYTYLDPGTLRPEIGNNPSRNRLYLDPSSGRLHRAGENEQGHAYEQSYNVTGFVRSA